MEEIDLTDLISLIQFFGSSIPSVYSLLQTTKNFYDDEKIKLNSKLIWEFGYIIVNFESLIQYITAKILSDETYSKQILQNQEELLFGYKKLIKDGDDYVLQKKQQILKVELLQQNPARILGTKDCQELIGGYFVKGYLTQLQKDDAISKVAIFACFDESKRSLMIELAETRVSNNLSSGNKKSDCVCSIF